MKTRLLAVDYGLARVGLAISDPLGITAQPLATLERRSDKQICREVAQIVAQHQIREVVVGLPLEMSGEVGEAAKQVNAFVQRLEKTIDVPVTLWDERLTTTAAERSLDESGMKWRKRKKVVDQIAACLILQGVLANRAGSGDPV